MAEPTDDVDVAVIGAGFAGLYALHTFRDRVGMRVRVYEASGGVGGTWDLNRYPGARCDSESYLYCYSFSKELLEDWVWRNRYPGQDELLAYLNHVADRFSLREDIALNTRIESAVYDGDLRCWKLTTADNKTVLAQWLVTAVGLLAAAPYWPVFEGIDDFAGLLLHTGQWPTEPVDLAGKRVGVIGTGSSGVQLVPTIAEEVEQLYVFQRSPQYAISSHNRPVPDATRREILDHYSGLMDTCHRSPGAFPWKHNGRSALEDTAEDQARCLEELWAEGGFKFVWGSYRDLMTNVDANRIAADFVRTKIREMVADPEVAEMLVPPVDEPLGARRPIVELGYFESFNRDNVTLVDVKESPITRFVENGIETENGTYELDIVILATGFDAVTGPFLRMDIRGEGGVQLRDKWADGPHTYLGLATSGFPNLLMIAGPGSMFVNYPVLMEHHVDRIADLLAHARSQGVEAVDVSAELEAEWDKFVRAQAARSVVALGRSSWFNGTNIPGKPNAPLFYFGSYADYRRMVDDEARSGFAAFAEHPKGNAASGSRHR